MRLARRRGTPAGRVDLPELDDLRLRPLLPTSPRPPGRPTNRSRMGGDFYAPDGSLIDLPFPLNVLAYESVRQQHKIVARTTRYRHGVRLLVSTVFLGFGHNPTGFGLPLLYESAVFHGGDRRHLGSSEQCWRYASRDAALAGHRAIVHALDLARWERRRVLDARVEAARASR